MKRWVVLILVAALAGAAILAFLSRKPADRAGVAEEAVWLPIAADTVREIDVEGSSGAYALVRDDQSWTVRAGGEGTAAAKADPAKVKALIDFLSLNKPEASLSTGHVDPDAAYGLDHPRLRLTVRTAPAKGQAAVVAVLSLGRATSDNAGVHAANSLSPGTIFLLSSSWERQVDHPAEYYLDTRVFSLAERDVTRVRSSGPAGVNWEVAAKDGGFVFLQPDSAKDKTVSESDMRLFIHDLVGLKSEPAAVAPADPGPASLKIEVFGGSGGPETLEIFRAPVQQGLVLARSTWRKSFFALDAGAVDKVTKSGFDLEGRKVLDLDTGKVQSLNIRAGSQSFLVQKADSGWTDQDSGKALRGIDMALWRLTDMQFEAEPSQILPGSAEWAMTCEALDKSGGRLVVLDFYQDASLRAGLCWVRVNGGASYFPVPDQLLKDLQGLFPLKK